MKTATKITLGIVGITSVILIFINVFVFYKTQIAFQEGIRQYDTAFINGAPSNSKLIIKPRSGALPPIEQKFYNNLSLALIISAVLGIILAIFAGSFFSKAITRPLNHLKDGINKLRSDKSKGYLSKTGEAEFDEVIDEFNILVKELNYQENLQTNLISDVAHELKTPITALIGQLQGVKDGILKLDDDRFNILIGEMDRLSKLTDSLNDYTRVKSKFPYLKKSKVDLKKVVDTLNDNYKLILESNGIQIINNVPDSTIIDCDRDLLLRISNNLIDNSIAYSECKNIKISYSNDSLTFEDDGTGIEQEHLSKIFERFYRIEKSRNRKTGGLGLGLSMVKEIAEAHNWSVNIESDLNGTKFIFNLHTLH